MRTRNITPTKKSPMRRARETRRSMEELYQMSASSLILPCSSLPVALPAPRRGAIHVREATLEDLPFIDALQERTTKQVGFLHRKALEGKIALGHVLVAEGVGS